MSFSLATSGLCVFVNITDFLRNYFYGYLFGYDGKNKNQILYFSKVIRDYYSPPISKP